MGNISIKINLRQFKNIIKDMKRKDGSSVKCLVLPIESNQFHVGEKGIYVDLTAFQIKNKVGDSKDTHLIKQSFAKEVFDSMTDEEKKAMPILGNAIVWGASEPEPQTADIADDADDDLPF